MNETEEEAITVPLGIPPLRQWELDENSSRYDKLVAAPSDEDLNNMWLAWIVTSWVVAAFILTVLLAILINWKARQNAFNIYLCFLMLSDFVFSFLCGVTCLLNHLHGHYFAPWMCRFQSFYCIWAIGSSIWMNAVIAWQIHTMLRSGHIRLRYQVPSRRTVVKHSLLVYLFNAIVALLGILPYEANFPHRSYAVNGEACLPTEYNVPSTIFMFLGFFPLVAGIPVGYILWVSMDVYQKGLVPPTGRRRALSIYFARITLSLLVMWVPFFLMVFCAAKPWVNFIGGTWSHLQGAVSALFGLLKPDTQSAYVQLWWHCHWCGDDTDEIHKQRDSWISKQFLDSWVSTTRQASSRLFSLKRSNSDVSAHLGFGSGVSLASEADNAKAFSSIQDIPMGDQALHQNPTSAGIMDIVTAAQAELLQDEEEKESESRELKLASIPHNSETYIMDDDHMDESLMTFASNGKPIAEETCTIHRSSASVENEKSTKHFDQQDQECLHDVESPQESIKDPKAQKHVLPEETAQDGVDDNQNGYMVH